MQRWAQSANVRGAPLFAHLAEWAAVNLDKVEQARHDYDTGPR